MRLGWTRSLPELTPAADDVQAMLRAGLPDARVRGFKAVAGGFANTNIRVDCAEGPVLLRLYQRDAQQAAKEAALARRLAATVPVARFLHIGSHGDYRFALVEWIEGERLEVTLPDMAAKDRRAAGQAAGAALAAIHRHTYEQVGFLDAALNVSFAVPEGFVMDFLRGSVVDGPANARLGNDLARAAMDYAAAHRHLAWGGKPCLIHSDFNGSNILMRGTAIAAIVDWEFAMSARPDADFGNLLRNHPDEDFLGGVVDGYRAGGSTLPEDWRTLARLSDLVAWADMLSRPGLHDSVVESARRAIKETVSGAGP
jgi:aminoglycoside phosphotransferase (APT) family kinase protein